MEPNRLVAWVLWHWGAALSAILSLFPHRRWIVFDPQGEAIMTGDSQSLSAFWRLRNDGTLSSPVYYKHGRITRRTTISRQHTFMMATGDDDAEEDH